jgi:hypothetical protein
MAKKRQTGSCSLCGLDAELEREHVLPVWYLTEARYFPADVYTIELNGSPIVRRDGESVSEKHPFRRMLPICSDCNKVKLGKRFEDGEGQGGRAARCFFDGAADLDSLELALAAAWLMKTTILVSHPSTVIEGLPTGGTAPALPVRHAIARSLTDWMIAGVQPPDDVSCWVMRCPRSEQAQVPVDQQKFHLPVFGFDGTEFRSRVFQRELPGVDDLYSVHVVHHPGSVLTNPLESFPSVRRLSPHNGSSLDRNGWPVATDVERAQWNELWGSPFLADFEVGRDPFKDPLNLDGSYKPYDTLPGPVQTYPVSGSL